MSGTLEAIGLGTPADTRAEAELTFARRLRAWSGAHRTSLTIVPVLLIAVAVMHSWGLAHAPALNDDEGTYMAQAWSVVHEHRLEVYTYWYDHPPLGWMQLAAYTFFAGLIAPGAHAVVEGRILMVLYAVVSAGLLYVLARRLGLRRVYAATALILFGFSPLAVDYQRMVYLDNIAVPWVLGALVLAASPRRSLWAAIGAGCCLAVAVLSKETFLLFVPAAVLLLWQRSDPKTRSFCVTGLAATFVLLVLGYPLYALLKGELFPGSGHVSLWQGITFQLASRQSSGSPFTAGSAAHQTVASWLHLDPWLLLAGAVAAAIGLLSRRSWPLVLGFALPVLVALRGGGYLPEPFVIGLLPFAALLVAAALDWAAGPATAPGRHWRRIQRSLAALAAIGLLGALASAWYPGDRALTSTDATASVYRAEAWIETHVPKNQRMIIDDSLWVDLIRHGFDPDLGAVWFQKLDFTENLDPSVEKALPGGWRDFAYVISTPALRSSLAVAPHGFAPVRQALAHSVVVASFGSGAGLVQVRRIVGVAPLATVPDWPKPTASRSILHRQGANR